MSVKKVDEKTETELQEEEDFILQQQKTEESLMNYVDSLQNEEIVPKVEINEVDRDKEE